MRWICALLITINLSFGLYAQKDQVHIPLQSPNLQIVPVASGFLLMDFSGKRMNEQQLSLPFSLYDNNLQSQWNNILAVTRGLQLQHYQVLGNYFFMVFGDAKNQFMEVFRVDLQQGHYQRSFYRFSNTFQISALAANGQRLWAAGTMANQGVLFELNESKNNYQILPTATGASVQGVRELHYHPQDQTLSFLMLTRVGKQQSYVLRVLGVKDLRVAENVELVPDDGLQLTQARVIVKDQKRWISGTFFKKNPQQAEGVFLYEIAQGKVSTHQFLAFKEIPQFSDYTFWLDTDTPPKIQSKKTQGNAVIDQVLAYDGGITVALEILEKSYKTKGALQQEIETNQLIANLDQDQFGRRALDQTPNESTAEDRILQRSATDILQYRYRNALVSQPTFQGMVFERSMLISFDDQLQLRHFKALKTGKPDLIYLGAPNTFQNGEGLRLFYDRGGEVYAWNYQPNEGDLTNFVRKEYASGSSSRVFRLSTNEFMVVELHKETAGYILKLQKLPF